MPSFFFFFNDTATTEIYTLSLHDALPISSAVGAGPEPISTIIPSRARTQPFSRSEEHTSELQSRPHLVCRLLLEKKKKVISRGHVLVGIELDYVTRNDHRGRCDDRDHHIS